MFCFFHSKRIGIYYWNNFLCILGLETGVRQNMDRAESLLDWQNTDPAELLLD
jgi:hypothetical protein